MPTYATRAAALAALIPGFAAIFVPDFARGHYELCALPALAAVPLYQLIAAL